VVAYSGVGYYDATLDWNSPNDHSSGNPYSVSSNGRVVYTPNGGGAAVSYTRYLEILGPYPNKAFPDDRTNLGYQEQ
jgi:hypothetical protein